MSRRRLALLAILSIVTLASACSDITSPSQDGETGRCQVTVGSDTRC